LKQLLCIITEAEGNDMDHSNDNQERQDASQTEKTSFIDLPSRFDKWEPLAEVIATVVLAFATLATAWSGYQSARWGGEQSTSYSQAGALRTESTRASNQAGQLVQVDIGLFTNWINAYANDQTDLTNFYEQRFREEFKPAFDTWLAMDPRNNPEAPPSPLSMPEYRVAKALEADSLREEAEKMFAVGQDANQTSDDYILNTVILASVLFLGGISSRFKAMAARWTIILFSLLILIYGLFNLFSYPIQ
jgi:hypothetical protein